MGLSFFSWAMAEFDRQRFGICGATRASVERNILFETIPALEKLGFEVVWQKVKGQLTVHFGGHENTFYLYGALDGQRVDHTMANFQALQYLSERRCRGFLVGCRQIATTITNGSLVLPAYFEGYLSLFCLGKDATGIQIRGTKYTLQNASLSSGFPLGVSNQFIGEPSQISVEDGTLLLIWPNHNDPQQFNLKEGIS